MSGTTSPNNEASIPNKVALVTGGGTGIGRATSLALAKMGIAVGIGYSRSRDDAEATVRDIEREGGTAVALQADVADDEQARRMVEQIAHRWGRLDIVVNNAAMTRFVSFTDLDDLTGDDWDTIMAVNVKGAFFISRAAARVMKAARGGTIVNVGSIAGLRPSGSSIAYCSSKAALTHMSRCLARALAPTIRVNVVAPGFVDTRWNAGRTPSQLPPLGRVAQPEDVAEVIVDVATGFRHVTGEVILVDGGAALG